MQNPRVINDLTTTACSYLHTSSLLLCNTINKHVHVSQTVRTPKYFKFRRQVIRNKVHKTWKVILIVDIQSEILYHVSTITKSFKCQIFTSGNSLTTIVTFKITLIILTKINSKGPADLKTLMTVKAKIKTKNLFHRYHKNRLNSNYKEFSVFLPRLIKL